MIIVKQRVFCESCDEEYFSMGQILCGSCGKYTGDFRKGLKSYVEIIVSPSWRFWNIKKILAELPKETNSEGNHFNSMYEMLSWKQDKLDEYLLSKQS